MASHKGQRSPDSVWVTLLGGGGHRWTLLRLWAGPGGQGYNQAASSFSDRAAVRMPGPVCQPGGHGQQAVLCLFALEPDFLDPVGALSAELKMGAGHRASGSGCVGVTGKKGGTESGRVREAGRPGCHKARCGRPAARGGQGEAAGSMAGGGA